MLQVIVFFTVTVTIVSAGLVAVPSARILQGPSSRTTIVGPDGSSISAYAPGGQVILDGTPALVAPASPVVYAAPAVAVAAPASPVRSVIAANLEGQYVPDNTEALYDDGSYKPEIYGY